jgi:hypothetical protein
VYLATLKEPFYILAICVQYIFADAKTRASLLMTLKVESSKKKQTYNFQSEGKKINLVGVCQHFSGNVISKMTRILIGLSTTQIIDEFSPIDHDLHNQHKLSFRGKQ